MGWLSELQLLSHDQLTTNELMDQRVEQWRPVPSWEGFYEVSDHGRVRSVDRRIKSGCSTGGYTFHMRRGKIMKGSINNHGYVQVWFRNGPIVVYPFVHRLVLETFVSLCPDGKQCNHIDGNRRNNALYNLEWVTAQENCLHAAEVLGRSRGCNNGRNVLTEEQVKEIRASSESQRAIAARLGVSRSTIKDIRSRRIWGWL